VGEWGIVWLTSAVASQQIMGKSSVRDDYQLKALKVLMISKGFVMRICEGGITSLEVKCNFKIPAVRKLTCHTVKVIRHCNQLS